MTVDIAKKLVNVIDKTAWAVQSFDRWAKAHPVRLFTIVRELKVPGTIFDELWLIMKDFYRG